MEKEKKVSGQLQAPAKKSTSTKKTTGAKVKSREDAPENTNKKETSKNDTKKISAKSEKKERVQVFEENPRSKKMIHQIMPYLLMDCASSSKDASLNSFLG